MTGGCFLSSMILKTKRANLNYDELFLCCRLYKIKKYLLVNHRVFNCTQQLAIVTAHIITKKSWSCHKFEFCVGILYL